MPAGMVAEARAPAARTWLRARLICGDLVAALTLGIVAAGVAPLSSALLGTAAGAAVFVFANRVQNLYRSYASAARLVAYAGVVRSALVAAVASRVVIGWAGVDMSLARTAVSAVALVAVAIALRSRFDRWVAARRASGRFRRTVVAIGDAADVARLELLFRSTPSLGYDLVGAVGPCDPVDSSIPWFGDISDAAAVVRLVEATGVVVCPGALGGVELRATLSALQADGIHVHVASGLVGVDHRRLRPVGRGDQPFLYLDPPDLTRGQLCAKRVLDVVLASAVLLLTLPVLLLAAAAVKLGDGGPIFFRQERVGRDGRRFMVHKLRTMEVDAEGAPRRAAQSSNERSGPLFKLADGSAGHAGRPGAAGHEHRRAAPAARRARRSAQPGRSPPGAAVGGRPSSTRRCSAGTRACPASPGCGRWRPGTTRRSTPTATSTSSTSRTGRSRSTSPILPATVLTVAGPGARRVSAALARRIAVQADEGA